MYWFSTCNSRHIWHLYCACSVEMRHLLLHYSGHCYPPWRWFDCVLEDGILHIHLFWLLANWLESLLLCGLPSCWPHHCHLHPCHFCHYFAHWPQFLVGCGTQNLCHCLMNNFHSNWDIPEKDYLRLKTFNENLKNFFSILQTFCQ